MGLTYLGVNLSANKIGWSLVLQYHNPKQEDYVCARIFLDLKKPKFTLFLEYSVTLLCEYEVTMCILLWNFWKKRRKKGYLNIIEYNILYLIKKPDMQG